MKRTTLLLDHPLTPQARLWGALGLFVALAFAPQPTQAAVTEAWVHRYNNVASNSQDQAIRVVRDSGDNIIVAGYTDDGTSGHDMLTIKYSGANGSVLWQKRYNGPANDSDYPTALAVDGSGNVVVTGRSSNGTNYNFYYTAKYAAADGALLWEKRSNGGGQALAVDGSGNVVVTGSYYNGPPNYDSDHYTAKYAAADGALVWEQRYTRPANRGISAQAVAIDGTGNVVVTGYTYNGTNNDYYTAKYAAANGALLWERRFNAPANREDQAIAVAVDANGNVVVTGYSTGNDSYSDYYTAKYAAENGALLWEKRYNSGTNSTDQAQAVAVDESGNVVVTGNSFNESGAGYYTANYAAADGALLWEKRSNGGSEYSSALALDASGNVVVTGYSYGGSWDYYTAKHAAMDGALLWEKRYNGPANGNDQVQSVTVDGNGNVLVTGFSNNGDLIIGDDDCYTAKYAAADGALLWEKRYNGPASNNDGAIAVAVDGAANVVVTGSSGSYNLDFYTAKYAARDGALLWERRYNGPFNSGDIPSALAVDGSDNVVVIGSSRSRSGWLESDYYTAKYAAADGALLWEKRYNGPFNSEDLPSALAVDANGNVVVTGGSATATDWEGYPIYDYYTAKYAAADGVLLWEKRYNGPADGWDSAGAVAVDGNGNVVVTGYSYNGTNDDFRYTAKYAAADGALLWEKRSTGGGHAVVVDGGGNVIVTGGSTIKYLADGTAVWTNTGAGLLAVDGNGNVVVSGIFYNGHDFDYDTAKYAAADGALLWEKRYNGPANSHDFAKAVAVDDSGNVVVTGGSDNADFTNPDYYTAKYAAADGALLWEKRYNGPANRYDTAYSLALGPNGMVAITGSSSGDYATVVYRETLPPVSIALVPGGVRLRVIGIPGRSYTIEHAPAVTGPWTTINTQTAPASGLLEYVDAFPPPGQAFYRTVQP